MYVQPLFLHANPIKSVFLPTLFFQTNRLTQLFKIHFCLTKLLTKFY